MFCTVFVRLLTRRASPTIASLSPLLLRLLAILTAVTLLLFFRISLLHGQLPHFSDHDNPASFAPHAQTRALTYSYLCFFNAQLLVAPLTLCYDWQMGSIPLVERLSDARNLGTLLLVVYLTSLGLMALFGKVLVSLLVYI